MKHGIGVLFALGLVPAIATASNGGALTTAPPSRAAEPAPVASLRPAKTEALANFAVVPATADVPARGTQRLASTGANSDGNTSPVTASWSLEPSTIGTLSTPSGSETTFTAGRTLGSASITATATNDAETVSATATLHVVPGRLHIESVTYRAQRNGVLVSVSARDAAGMSISNAIVRGLVRRNGAAYVSTHAVTGPAGRTTIRVPRPKHGSCLTTTIRRATAKGFTWDGKTPRNRICLPKPR